MSSIRFDAPPRGGEQLHNWLFRVSQDLNLALSSIDESNMTPSAASALAGGAAGAETKHELETNTATLRGMIIKNAEIVQSEMQALQISLAGTYVAQSDFGEYRDETQAQIDALPASITQTVLNTQTITDMQGAISQLATEGYIKLGIVGYEEDEQHNTIPVVGIAIGQNVSWGTGTETVGGIEYKKLDMTQSLGVYTSKGLSFYVGGTEVAYMKDQKLYVTSAKIADDFEQGPWKWERNAKGLTLRYMG